MWRCVWGILFAVSATAMAAEPDPVAKQGEAFRVSPACLASAEAGVEDQTGLPVLYIRLDEAGGELLHDFTASRVGHTMRLVDGSGEPLMASAPVIQSPLDRALMLTGFESRREAEAVAKRLRRGDGACGPL